MKEIEFHDSLRRDYWEVTHLAGIQETTSSGE